MEIRVVNQYRDFLNLKEQWNDLLKRSLHPIVFLTHQWIDTWWRSFGSGKSLFILLVYDNKELSAIAPLMIHEADHVLLGKPHIVIKARKIEFIANVHSNRVDFIFGNKPSEACEAIVKFLIDDCSKQWDIISLEYLLLQSPSVALLKNALRQKNMAYRQYALISSPFVPINCTWKEYEQNISATHKRNMARKIKKLSKNGKVIYKKYDNARDLESILEQIFTVASKSWKAKENTALSSTEQSRAFYTDLAYTAAKEGWLEIYVLYFNEIPLVFYFALRFDNRLLILKTEFDENYSEYSVGHMLTMNQLKNDFDRGLDEVDFLGPTMPWKTTYCKGNVKDHISLHVFNKNYRGLCLNVAHRTKDTLKKLFEHNGMVIWYRQRESKSQHKLSIPEIDASDPAKEEIILEQEGKENILSIPNDNDDTNTPRQQISNDIPEEEVIRLISERTKARQERDWHRADEIRDILVNKGVEISDSRQGTTWRYVNSKIHEDGLDGR